MLISLAVLAVMMGGCNSKNTKQADQSAKVLVKTLPATQAEVEQIAEFTGIIQPYQQNVICPSTPVRIDDILVDVGAHVNKGQLLVKMDQTQYRQAMVQLANLENDYQRMKAVYEANGISKQQIDAQETQVKVSRESAENLLVNTELRSPLTGVVTGRYYDPGDMFSLSPKDGVTGILTVMQIDRLKIEINVSEQYFPDVKMGMPVELRIDLFPDQVFTGKVSLIYPAIDASTRTFTVEVTIPNGKQTLRPGMFSRATMNFGSHNGVLVEDLALQKQVGSNEKYVFVVKDGKAERRTVDVGRQIGHKYAILSGIEPGEEVVVAGMSKLSDGTEVEVKNN